MHRETEVRCGNCFNVVGRVRKTAVYIYMLFYVRFVGVLEKLGSEREFGEPKMLTDDMQKTDYTSALEIIHITPSFGEFIVRQFSLNPAKTIIQSRTIREYLASFDVKGEYGSSLSGTKTIPSTLEKRKSKKGGIFNSFRKTARKESAKEKSEEKSSISVGDQPGTSGLICMNGQMVTPTVIDLPRQFSDVMDLCNAQIKKSDRKYSKANIDIGKDGSLLNIRGPKISTNEEPIYVEMLRPSYTEFQKGLFAKVQNVSNTTLAENFIFAPNPMYSGATRDLKTPEPINDESLSLSSSIADAVAGAIDPSILDQILKECQDFKFDE